MKITQKLLGLLHRVFDKDPHSFTALRLDYDGGMVWTVADGFLYTVTTGGSGSGLTIDLSQYTIGQLANYLGSQQGYSIRYVDRSTLSLLSARILIDGTNDISTSNGDQILAYTNVLWSYIDANANELELARTQIAAMLQQMSTTTAADEWLDNLGAMYGVPRMQGELDNSYGPRIIAEVLRPKSNNVAIENAISYYTGQTTTVSDVTLYGPTTPLYNAAISRNSAWKYQASAAPLYGLFDVQYGYDLLNGGDVTTFTATVAAIVDGLRAAGTHMRSLSLQGSNIGDALTPPTDGGNLAFAAATVIVDMLTAPTDSYHSAAVLAGFADTLTVPTDAEMEVVRYGYAYNGVRTRNSKITYAGGTVAITPGPAIDWNFMTGSLDPSLTFARASIGTYFDANGVMQTAAAGAPRFDHDPLTTKGIGLLIEESRTNGLTYSQAFDNAAWVNTGATVTAGAVTAPDGSLTGAHIGDASAASASKNVAQSGLSTILATNPCVCSVFAQAAEYNFVLLRCVASGVGGADYFYGVFNLATGAVGVFGNVGAASGATPQIQALPGGWYRCSMAGTPSSNPSATNVQSIVAAQPTNSNGNVRTGTVGSGCYVWGAQLEAGAFSTSYIPTTNAAVTRSADLLTTTSFPWFNASTGTFAVEAAVMYTLSANGISLASFDNGSTNGLMLYKPSGGAGITGFSGSGSASVSGASYSNGQVIRAALKYSSSGASAYANALGRSPAPIVGSAVSATTLSIGSARSGAFLLTGWIRRFTYVASALDTSLLALLTT